MRTEIYTIYSKESDITFIMEDIYISETLISTEVKGFYFGEPKDEYTKEYYGELKADFTPEL